MILNAFVLLTPIGMIVWGGTTFVVRLRRQRRRRAALPSERFDASTLIDRETATPTETTKPGGSSDSSDSSARRCDVPWDHCALGCITACDHDQPCLDHTPIAASVTTPGATGAVGGRHRASAPHTPEM